MYTKYIDKTLFLFHDYYKYNIQLAYTKGKKRGKTWTQNPFV